MNVLGFLVTDTHFIYHLSIMFKNHANCGYTESLKIIEIQEKLRRKIRRKKKEKKQENQKKIQKYQEKPRKTKKNH